MSRRARKPFLQLIEGPAPPRRFVLNQPETIVGRDDQADITLSSSNVSRRHARIMCRPHEVTIHDFESRNGVFLNGIKVHSAVLRDGDIVQLGDFVFEFCEE